MAVSFFNEDVPKPSLKYTGVKKWLTSEIENMGFVVGNINYIFCSDEYLLEMNRKHLEHDYYTDIITFNYCEDKEISGDMYISVDRIKKIRCCSELAIRKFTVYHSWCVASLWI
jgi:ssRNA-specific RNase YbeY (16S rRNA maturation enzyme)